MRFGKGLTSTTVVAALCLAACSSPATDPLQQGQAFVAKGELASAVIAFRNAVQASPAAPPARLALGDALERTGDLTSAEQHYRRALELGGDPAYLVPKIAIILMDRSDLMTLVHDFGGRELPTAAANSDLRGILASTYLILGEKTKALEELSKVKVQTPAVRLARAQLALSEGRDADASAELDRALKEKEPPWWVLRAVARVYWAKGNSEKALDAMQSAHARVGAHPDVMGEYAEKLLRAGKVDQARKLLVQLKVQAPSHYRTAVLDAMLQVESGNYEAAYASAVRVLVALPEHLPMLLLAAKVEVERGELLAAETRLQKILSQNPQMLEALRLRYLLELRQGKVQLARSTLDKALRVAPTDPGLLAAAADLAWARGDKGSAIRQITLASEQEPAQAPLLARLAEMKHAVGQVEEARNAIDRAIELSGKQATNREAVLRATLRMRFLDKAKAMVQSDIAKRAKDPEPLMWMAAVLGQEGNTQGAFEHTNLALDARADYYPALFALARMLNSPEREKAYAQRLQTALGSGSRDARVYLDQVRRLQRSGAGVEQLGAVFDQGLKADPRSVELRDAAVRYWLAQGRKDRALTLATEGEAAQPDKVALVALAASTNQAMGNHETAVKKYGQLVARFPGHVDWTLTYAGSLIQAGRSVEALAVLGKLVAQRPEEPRAYRALATLQMDEKKPQDAVVTAHMLRDYPRLSLPGLLLLGDVYARAGDKQEALKAYAELAKAGAGDVAMARKIGLLDRLKLDAQANTELKQWLQSSPNNVQALSLAAKREYAKENYAASAHYLERIVELQPRNPTALNDLAWCYTKSKNPAALAVAKKAVELDPQNANLLDTLAEAQALAGQTREAMATLRQAQLLAPELVSVKSHLAQLSAGAGEQQPAEALPLGADERKPDRNAAARLQADKNRL